LISQLIIAVAFLGAAPTYADDIEPIVRKHCVACHQEGEAGPMALTDYKRVRQWAGMMREVIGDGRMPPWGANPNVGDFVNARIVSDSEKQLLDQWIEADKPSGDLSKVPPFVRVKREWRRPDPPDVVIAMPEPFEIPATGLIDYHYATVDPKFEHDVWLKDVEFLPGNRKVVHHAGILIEPPADSNLPATGFSDAALAGYLPGAESSISPPVNAAGETPWGFRIGAVIPARSKLRFQMHYTSIGTPQRDQSKVGIWTCDISEVDRVAVAINVWSNDLVIPPYSERTAVSRFSEPLAKDTALYSLNGHMHLRGKSFQFIAHYPDKRTEMLLDVVQYNFDMQDTYLLKQPKTLPAGTRVEGIAVFDNSAKNARNPDPAKEVRWGEQTEDEMWLGNLITYVPKEEYLASRRGSAKVGAPAASK